MGFSCGIVGLPNVGKSTIFNALTAIGVPAEAFPFCTIEPNIGKVVVPDNRLKRIADLIQPERVTPSMMEFVDIAGLVKGASTGEGLGNQFLGHIRDVTAIVTVVRCFEDANVAHVTDELDPEDDIDVINLELILADIATVDKKLEKLNRLAKVGDKSAMKISSILQQIKDHLDEGKPARTLPHDILSSSVFSDLSLVTIKPMMYLLNVSEDDSDGTGQYAQRAKQKALKEGVDLIVISGKIEAELMSLGDDDRMEFRQAIGLTENGLEKLIRAGYKLLELITFYTTVGPELRAWTIPQGTSVQEAAGKIHTDMERGFIKAEVINYDVFNEVGSISEAKESGLIRIEGKNYIVQDGDIIKIKFNV